jgi:replicative DNA helicase
LQSFINGIADSVNTSFIPTGFKQLDRVLEGGLYEGLYIIGAISSLGKTTLVLQIADQIAQQGNDVLVFSLEMARSELMAKSISRLTKLEALAIDGKTSNAKTTRGITTGSRYANYSQQEHAIINNAIKAYSEYAGNIYISEGIGDIGAAQIRETVAKHISFTGRTPVIIIDYLQILAPYSERATDKQNTDKAVMELKRISRDFKAPVLGISSFNRANYKEAVTMEAFKESGAIEYSSDVLIGLQLKGAGTKDFDANKAKDKNPREVELVVLKNRNGATGKKIEYGYYPLFNDFKEI